MSNVTIVLLLWEADLYYSDRGYGMSAVLGTNATPRADDLGE